MSGIDIFGKFNNRQAEGKLIDYKDIDGAPTNTLRSVLLTANNWVDNTQTVSVEGVTADNNILIGAGANPSIFGEAGIYCSAQADGSLTFKCTTTPTEDVLVSVYIGGSVSGENEITVDEEMSDESTNPVQNKVIKKYIDENAGGGGGGKLYKHIVTVRNNDSENLFEKTIYNSSPDKILTEEQIIKYMDFEGTFQDQNFSYATGTVFNVVAGTGEVVFLETPKTGWLIYMNANGESGLVLTYNSFINYMPGTGVYLNIPDGAKATIDGEEKSISTVAQGMPIGLVGDPDYDCFREPEWEPLDPAKMVFTDTVTEMGASGGSGGSGGGSTLYRHALKVTFDFTANDVFLGASSLNMDAPAKIEFFVSLNSSKADAYTTLASLPKVVVDDSRAVVPINSGSRLIPRIDNGNYQVSGYVSNLTYATSGSQEVLLIDGVLTDANDVSDLCSIMSLSLTNLSIVDTVTEIGSAGGGASSGSSETQEEKLAKLMGGMHKHDILYSVNSASLGGMLKIAITLYTSSSTPFTKFSEMDTTLRSLQVGSVPACVGMVSGILECRWMELDDDEFMLRVPGSSDYNGDSQLQVEAWGELPLYTTALDAWLTDGSGATFTDTVTAL